MKAWLGSAPVAGRYQHLTPFRGSLTPRKRNLLAAKPGYVRETFPKGFKERFAPSRGPRGRNQHGKWSGEPLCRGVGLKISQGLVSQSSADSLIFVVKSCRTRHLASE